MESPTRLALIRHGEVEARYHRVFGGRIDMELSPFGKKQAAALAEYLKRVQFQAIYSSPMKRVQQTLAEFVHHQDRSAKILEGLREVDFGVWTGLSWDEVQEKFAVTAFQWLDQLECGAIAEAETIPDFRKRVGECLTEILDQSAGENVAVVCHGGVIRMLLSLLLDLPIKKMACFEIEYASVTIVSTRPGKTEVELLNFTPWRDLS